jgi:hypothetical protein
MIGDCTHRQWWRYPALNGAEIVTREPKAESETALNAEAAYADTAIERRIVKSSA